ncbi:MAG: hypothetical protein E7334_10825 [Clostridiales bacterium]|nr:hypothetical protein [Clostridiales bacterium]
MNKKIFHGNGTQHITNAINTAIAQNKRTTTITGNWEIDSAIRIPSNFALVLDGCHLKMTDNSFSNMFINEHHDTIAGKTANGTDHNIKILGKNCAILDGGNYNGLSEKTQNQNGLPSIWKNNLILFTNVDNFEIAGVSCHNQRWWALNFIFSSNGYLHDIDFKACDIWIDENGSQHHGLIQGKYNEILIKNADGINLRQGCHNITIENITGFTEDDAVALTGKYGALEQAFEVENFCKDIHHITIKNIATSTYCTNVRLLNQGGTKLHDIYIDGVYDTSNDSPHMDKGIYTVRIGDTHLYGTRHATKDETYNITVKNIRSRAYNAAISLVGGMSNVAVENVECFDGTIEMEDKRDI